MSEVIEFAVTGKGYMNNKIYREGDTFDGDKSTPKASWYERSDGKPMKKVKKTESVGAGEDDVANLSNENLDGRAQALQDAFDALDPSKDEDWTAAGLPSMDALNKDNEGDDFKRTECLAAMTRDTLKATLANG